MTLHTHGDKLIATINVYVKMNEKRGGTSNHNPRGQLNNDASFPYDKPGSLSVVEPGCRMKERKLVRDGDARKSRLTPWHLVYPDKTQSNSILVI